MVHVLTDEDRRRGARRTNEIVATRSAENRRSMVKLAELVEGLEREDMTTAGFAVFMETARQMAETGAPVPTTPGEWRTMVDTMVAAQKIMRLELGESTANTITANVDLDQLATRIERLKAKGAE